MSFSTRLLLAGVVLLIGLIVYAAVTKQIPIIQDSGDGSGPSPEITPGASDPREKPEQEFVFGSVTYQVTDQQDASTLGEGTTEVRAKGRFHIVVLAVRNDAPEPLQFGVDSFALFDERGRRFSANARASALAAAKLPAEDPFAELLQPGLTAAWAIAFDVPQDATKLVLRISQGYVEVDLAPAE